MLAKTCASLPPYPVTLVLPVSPPHPRAISSNIVTVAANLSTRAPPSVPLHPYKMEHRVPLILLIFYPGAHLLSSILLAGIQVLPRWFLSVSAIVCAAIYGAPSTSSSPLELPLRILRRACAIFAGSSPERLRRRELNRAATFVLATSHPCTSSHCEGKHHPPRRLLSLFCTSTPAVAPPFAGDHWS